MNLYFAPLEGIGGYIYRNAQADYFEKQINIIRRFWHRTKIGAISRRNIRTLRRSIMKTLAGSSDHGKQCGDLFESGAGTGTAGI